jgi:hypothetical protein
VVTIGVIGTVAAAWVLTGLQRRDLGSAGDRRVHPEAQFLFSGSCVAAPHALEEDNAPRAVTCLEAIENEQPKLLPAEMRRPNDAHLRSAI